MENEFDLVLLSDNIPLEIAKLRQKLKFKHIIIMPGNSFKRSQKWEAELKQLGLEYTNLQKHDSFVMKL